MQENNDIFTIKQRVLFGVRGVASAPDNKYSGFVLCKPTLFFQLFIANMYKSHQTSFNSAMEDRPDKYHVSGTRQVVVKVELVIIKARVIFTIQRNNAACLIIEYLSYLYAVT